MLDYSKYENTKTYPEDLYKVRRDLKILKKTSTQMRETPTLIQEIEALQTKLDELEYQEKEHNMENARLHDLWKHDLFKTYEVLGNSKVDKAFNLAWEYGHSSGLHEVEIYFSDLVELIKEQPQVCQTLI